MTASERLLKYLKTRKSATSAQIYAATGIWRVSSAILYLRRVVKVKTTMITAENRHGETVRIASYSLMK
ncbi:MAG: helix-turn-helix domain-containing protein [Candidatus Obscuribacterales bacterium]|jgi:hypothetical protein